MPPFPSPLAPQTGKGQTALLIIDMISCWDFPDADRLVEGAVHVAPRIAAFKLRCARAGLPIIYANDNYSKWRSDFATVIERSHTSGGPGATITQTLMPQPDDYFVLKPKHSAFFATPLELLLRNLGVGRLLLTGVASDQCVLATAAEARMRDLEIVVPRDCVASQSQARNEAAIRHFEEVLMVETKPSAELLLPARKEESE